MREYGSHRRARRSWLSSVCAKEPKKTESGSNHALLSPLAFLPASISSGISSLHDQLVQGQLDSRTTATHLGTLYAGEFTRRWERRQRPTSKRDFWSETLRHWPSARVSWTNRYFWHEAGLPNMAVPCLLDNGQMYWNPIHLAGTADFVSDEPITCVRSFQHGDLNTENVLVVGDQSVHCQVIDFEKAALRSHVLDVCWLSLWALRSSHRSVPPAFEQWNQLPGSFQDAVDGREPMQDIGNFGLGLQVTRALFRPLLADTSDSETPSSRQLKLERVRDQISLTMAAASLAMAFYETRSLVRLLDTPIEKRDTSDQRFYTSWAATYLRVSARFLRGHVSNTPSGPVVDVTESLLSSTDNRVEV